MRKLLFIYLSHFAVGPNYFFVFKGYVGLWSVLLGENRHMIFGGRSHGFKSSWTDYDFVTEYKLMLPSEVGSFYLGERPFAQLQTNEMVSYSAKSLKSH
jgi:hypothetical protein